MTAATRQCFASLASRLSDSEDREIYADLISYIDSLPENDELFRLAQLLGLVSLLGQRLPDALFGCITEIRKQAEIAAHDRARIEERLGRLPDEITAGVEITTIAKAVGEAIRQHIHTVGLQESVVLLRSSASEMKIVASKIANQLQPYRALSSQISVDIHRLTAAANQAQDQFSTLTDRRHNGGWRWLAVLAVIVFLLGGLCGVLLENHQIASLCASQAGRS